MVKSSDQLVADAAEVGSADRARGAAGRRRRREAGAETRRRIVEAALAALRDEGYAGATARSIAARGGFNPALIFYHFGGVDELFLAALQRTSSVRLERYRAALDGVTGVTDLVRVLRTLYSEDVDAAHIAAIQELVAASAFSTTMGSRLATLMEPWFAFATDLLSRVLAATPLAFRLNPEDLAFGMVALYIGLETMTRLTGHEAERIAGLFESAERLAALIEPLLGDIGRKPPAPARPSRVDVE